jgi:aspartyl-tRNA(Asn)/glutamyl-tRNA(Gln) amidotransferase subunit B
MTLKMTAGLEIHVRLKTATKLFCNCSNETFGAEPNSKICGVCAGFPGTLPVLNAAAVKLAAKTAAALNCKIHEISKFDRKSYFYPDLPAGFQISQFFEPIATGGFCEFFVGGEKKSVRINRVHLENDAGKLSHAGKNSLVDLNRAGSPLIEIVTEPDFHSTDEIFEFLKNLQRICRFCETADADMEKGQMRCDLNVSMAPESKATSRDVARELTPDLSRGLTEKLGTKVEIKNLNSFANAKKAAEFEIARQTKLISENRGAQIIQETRGFDAEKGITISQRGKEESADYRYFPEPDLPPVKISAAEISEIKKNLPELPAAKLEKYFAKNLPREKAETLANEKNLAEFFEKTAEICGEFEIAANWVLGEFLQNLRAANLQISDCKMSADALAELISLVESAEISGKIAKEIFGELFKSGESPKEFCARKNLTQISDAGEIEKICREVCDENAKIVADFKNGNERAIGALVGATMKKSAGKANPQMVNEVLRKILGE